MTAISKEAIVSDGSSTGGHNELVPVLVPTDSGAIAKLSLRGFSEYMTVEDEAYESQLLQDPYAVSTWTRYIDFKSRSPLAVLCFLYERACAEIPRSYKLWHRYLQMRTDSLAKAEPIAYRADFERVNDCFERALVLLNKMPRIWLMYLDFLERQPYNITLTRSTYDRALRALAITQHDQIWPRYAEWARAVGGIVAAAVWRRYTRFDRQYFEDFIEILQESEYYEEACRAFMELLNNPKFKSTKGKSSYQVWTEFCDLLIEHSENLQGIVDVERVIRAGIDLFKDQAGKLWANLATYFINTGELERARDTFEEGITTAVTVKDFSLVFDAYAEFEESIIADMMEQINVNRQDDENAAEDGSADLKNEIDLRLQRFEQLMDRRPFLINDVLLRQNCHNVVEWQKRIALWGDKTEMVVKTYAEACTTIDPKRAIGGFDKLWIAYAQLYIRSSDVQTARKIFEKATNVPFNDVNELANVWCKWAETELELGNFESAREVLTKATQGPKRSHVKFADDSLTPQQRIHKSSKIWMLYADIEESTGTIESTKGIYDRMLELRIATPQTIVNYANFLTENEYFEDSFKVYERGIALFSYPVAFELWNMYLVNFLKRYGGTQLERTRDLFQQALRFCPNKFSKSIYLLYARFEEEHGSIQHAMEIYDKASASVQRSDRMEVFKIFVEKSAQFYGLVSTRKIYEQAIDLLPDEAAREMCLLYADLERRLGEIDRARGILAHGSQFADPRSAVAYWETWQRFEVKYGNEETYKEMLRIKRSVQAQYNTDVGYVAAKTHALDQSSATSLKAADSTDPMRMLEMSNEAQLKDAPAGFVRAKSSKEDQQEQQEQSQRPSVENPDAIDIEI